MSGIDKAILCRELKEKGWTEKDNYQLVPPEKLWKNKPTSFYLYDARLLQEVLGEPYEKS